MVMGIILIVLGVATAGGITWWAIWAAGKLGSRVWTSPKSLPLIIAFWVGGTAMIVGGIYQIATDHPEPHHGARHGRVQTLEECRLG